MLSRGGRSVSGVKQRRRNARNMVVVAVLAISGVALWAAMPFATDDEMSRTGQRELVGAADVTTRELSEVNRAKVFFGHQSVGMNMLDGIGGVYAAHGAHAPLIEQEGSAESGTDGGFIRHAFIGENGKPFLKMQDFDAKLRSGIGRSVDVAMMKFCYVDIVGDTDVDGLFAGYRETMANLQRDFPNVTFVHTTVPLTTDQSALSTLKSWLTGGGSSAADNVARERLNELVRREYAGKNLFDLAAVESTTPDGTRSAGTYEGQPYFRLYDGYASDSGHLNEAGAHRAATEWLKVVARASGK